MTDPFADEHWQRLNEAIDDAYQLLATDEVDILASEFEEAVVLMIEIAEVRARDCVAEDHFEGTVFDSVIFPSAIHACLERGDVLLATLGRRGDDWHVVHLNPPYVACDFDLSEGDDHELDS